MEAFLLGHGVQMALPEDCVAAMMRLACDRTINGQLFFFSSSSYCPIGAFRDRNS